MCCRMRTWMWLTPLIVLSAASAFLLGKKSVKLPETSAKLTGTKAYVVQKVYWHYRDRSEPYLESEPSGAGFPEKVFLDRGLADAYRAQREREERKGRCPFEHGRGWGHSFPSLADFTNMPTGEFIDWLEAEGLEPPPGQRAAWEAWQRLPSNARHFDHASYTAWWTWWDSRFRSREGEPICDRIWEKLDKVRLLEVVEVEGP